MSDTNEIMQTEGCNRPAPVMQPEGCGNRHVRARPPLPPEFKLLCDLCRAGKLFDVQAWFKRNTYFEPATITSKQWPMGIAIETGFHSMVEVLLQNGVPPDGSALSAALWRRNEDFINLLLQHGADVRSVDFSDVVDTGSPTLMRLFIDRGADILTGYPIAKGLIEATRPLLGIYKTYIDKFPQLQFQADMALRHFCEDGGLRGVCLLLWLGANPRAKVPLDDDEDEDFWTTPLEAAAWEANLEILKRLKPNKAEDDLNHLLGRSLWRLNMEVVRYLVSLGADVNGRDADGQTLHREIMHSLEWKLDSKGSWNTSPGDAKQFVRDWFSFGAKWSPEREDYRSFRKCMSGLSAIEGYELIKLFREKDVITAAALADLLDTPKLREHLRSRHPAITNLVPQLAKWMKNR